MALASGARLGPYEVLGPLGAGGMGEVYRAKDTRLDRTVASLNHPHICVLHDVGRQDGVDFLVMEYLEGETLAERVAKGPLPIDQVLRYGTEIADALARAHKAHIVHRDLKPANVLLTKAGAKLRCRPGSSSSFRSNTTSTSPSRTTTSRPTGAASSWPRTHPPRRSSSWSTGPRV